MRYLFFLILNLTCSFSFSTVLDGAWNGKPFPVATLEKGVEAGKPAALAEWAFCSLSGVEGIPYDAKLIQERAEKAAQAGNALGHFVIASYQASLEGPNSDQKKLVTALKASRKGEHPIALWREGVFFRLGIRGYPKDIDKGMAQIKAAEKFNCLGAFYSLSTVYRTGELGEIDLEKSAAYLKKGLSFKSPYAAENICRVRIKEKAFRGMTSFFSEEEFLEAEHLLKTLADLKHPGYSYYYGDLLIRLRRPHEAIPYVIEAAKSLSYAAHALLRNSRSRSPDGRSILCSASDYKTEWRQAESVYQMGKANKTTKRLVATSYLAFVTNKHPKEAEGIKILEDLIKTSPRGDCKASHALARFLTEKYIFRKGVDRAEFDRGVNHYILHGRCRSSTHWLGTYYEYNKPQTRNIPKALAALHRAVEVNIGAWKRREKVLQKKLLKEATPEQRREAEDLIADEWPHGKKHRKKAFLKLKEIGDIPKDAEFDSTFRFPQAEGDL